MKDEKFEQVVLRDKEKRLTISRIPKQIKEEFIEFADAEFCEDYGMCFREVWTQYKFWRMLYENLDYKMSHIISLLESKEPQEDVEDTKNEVSNNIRMLNGNKIRGTKNDN